MEKSKNYYLGLDIGSSSVGLAVTDENYNVINYGRKPMLCVRLFEEAQSAEETRQKRTSRRRMERRKQRIALLQSLFAEEIYKTDPAFFIRLNSSDLAREDRDRDRIGRHTLFDDAGLTDVKYHAKYPTVYHLRRALMRGEEDDIRLIYLAAAHIVKYRGNFLYEGKDLQEVETFEGAIKGLNDAIEERNSLSEENYIPKFDAANASSLPAKAAELTKKREISAVLTETLRANTKEQKEMMNAAAGMKFSLIKIFNEEDIPAELAKSITFDDYEAQESELVSSLTDADLAVVIALKQLNDRLLMLRIKKQYKYISDAMIAVYEKHKKDLAVLKRLFRAFGKGPYALMFGEIKKEKFDQAKVKTTKNYSAYVNGGRYGHRKITTENKGGVCTKEEFYKTVKNMIDGYASGDNTDRDYILNEIEEGSFMPKVRSKDNASIPYQLHLEELRAILSAAARKHAFLGAKDEKGNSVTEKILSVLTFRVPYYVGPLNGASARSWLVRKGEGRIFPWNINDVVDLNASEERFVKRMTNKCSILKTADVLPKNSVIYSKYTALNELNKLKVNGEPIDAELKGKLFENVYLNPVNKKVTVRKLCKEIERLTGLRDVALSGYADEVKGSMASKIAFRKAFGDKADRYPDMVEDIIKYLTVHSDFRRVEQRVKTEYADMLTKEEISALRGLNYSGWGALSRDLLDGILLTDKTDGRRLTVLEIMEETTLCLNEIIFSPSYDFRSACAGYVGGERKNTITYEDVRELYCSPAVKRSVWQAIKMVKEAEKIMKCPPKKVFLEVTRRNDPKKRGKTTDSRKQSLCRLYAEAQKDAAVLAAFGIDIGTLAEGAASADNLRLRGDKLFLYYRQLGRCMYSGEAIDLDNLEAYDIDHIIPRTLKKDDSLDNRVLVKGELNKNKADKYPVPKDYRDKCATLWKSLEKMEFISKEKLAALSRVTPLTEEERNAFINRQIVETGQAVTSVGALFKEYFASCGADTEVEYIKAANVSEFRSKFGLNKLRDINDFHHAYDAYLNIVVGNVLTEKFQHNAHYGNTTESKNLDKVFESDVRSHREGGRFIWIKDNSRGEPSIRKVKAVCASAGVTVTKMCFKDKGAFYNETIYPKGEGLTPRVYEGVKSDVSKYGGYKSLKTAYFVPFISDKGKSKIVTLNPIPVLYDKMIESGKLTLTDYAERKLGLINPTVKYPGLKIRIQALFEIDGLYRVRIAGYTGNSLVFHNANEFRAEEWVGAYLKEADTLLKKIDGYTYMLKGTNKIAEAQRLLDAFTASNGQRLSSDKVDKRSKNRIILTDKTRNADIYDYFIARLRTAPYAHLPEYSSFLGDLIELRPKFLEVTGYEQILVLKEVLKAFGCNASHPSLKILGGKNTYCQCRISMNVTKRKIKFINESALGLRTNSILINDGK